MSNETEIFRQENPGAVRIKNKTTAHVAMIGMLYAIKRLLIFL
jgi:hypothetical protein